MESQNREVIRRIHRRICVPQEPLVDTRQPLTDCRIRWEILVWTISRSTTNDKRCMRRNMDIVTLVQFPLQIRQPYHHSQVLPHIRGAQFESCSQWFRGTELCSGSLAIFSRKDTLSLER